MREQLHSEHEAKVIPINRGREGAEQINGSTVYVGQMALPELRELRAQASTRASDAIFEVAILDDYIAQAEQGHGPDGGAA